MLSYGEKAAVRVLANDQVASRRYWMIVDALYDRFGRDRAQYVMRLANRLRALRRARGGG